MLQPPPRSLVAPEPSPRLACMPRRTDTNPLRRCICTPPGPPLRQKIRHRTSQQNSRPHFPTFSFAEREKLRFLGPTPCSVPAGRRAESNDEEPGEADANAGIAATRPISPRPIGKLVSSGVTSATILHIGGISSAARACVPILVRKIARAGGLMACLVRDSPKPPQRRRRPSSPKNWSGGDNKL